jgi:hypothetical protein
MIFSKTKSKRYLKPIDQINTLIERNNAEDDFSDLKIRKC